MDLSELRAHYSNARLDEPLPDAPWAMVREWFREALSHGEIKEPNAMSLATADDKGQPSVRLVLVKEIREDGFVFYTNYNSKKGQDIAVNPKVAGTVWWPEMERQIRIIGEAEKISPEDSTSYFQSRPKGSQLGAIVSPQSEVIPDADFLQEKLVSAQKAAENQEVLERPSYWGGYLIRAQSLELWMGQPNRLHDRILYRKEGNAWQRERLAP